MHRAPKTPQYPIYPQNASLEHIKDNPLYKYMRGRPDDQSRWPLWLILTGMLSLSVVGAIWLRLLDYPLNAMATMGALACIPATFIMMLLISVTGTLVSRETRAERYQLLYMTGIAERRVVWGYFFAMLLRLRLWVSFFVWVWTISLVLLSVVSTAETTGSFYDPQRYLPSLARVLGFVAVWGLYGLGLVTVGLSATIRQSLNRAMAVWTTTRTMSTLGLLTFLTASILFALLQDLEEIGWFVVAALLLTAIVGAVALLAQRWGLYWRYGLDVLANNLALWLLFWIIVALLIFVLLPDAQPYWYFVLYDFMLVMIVAEMMRLWGDEKVKFSSRMVAAFQVLYSALLVYIGLAGAQDFKAIITLGLILYGGFWVLFLVAMLMGVYRWTGLRHFLWVMPINGWMAVALYGLVLAVLPAIPESVHAILILALYQGYLFGALLRRWGSYAAMAAGINSGGNALLVTIALLSTYSEERAGQLAIALGVWALLLMLYAFTIRNSVAARSQVWNLRLNG